MSDTAQDIERITEEIVKAVTAEDWDVAAELEAKRRERLEVYLAETQDSPDAIEAVLQKVLGIEKELLQQVEVKQEETSTSLKESAKGKRAISAYAESERPPLSTD